MATALYPNTLQTRYDGERPSRREPNAPSKVDRDRHKSTNDRTGSLQCSFCEASHPSTEALREHLMFCGNKTDECPKCHKYIRRAVFAYHYENNCANLDETGSPTPRSEKPPTPRPRSSSSRPSSRITTVDNHEQEEKKLYNSSNHRSRTPVQRTSLDTVKCKFCQQQCTSTDYDTHQENCIKNPNNINKKLQRTSLEPNESRVRSASNESRSSTNIVRIPCEFCNEQIDLPSWSIHTQDCRERETRRIEARAQSISREPVIEKLPCEYCEELFPSRDLRDHEILCPKNPARVARAAKVVNSQPTLAVLPSNRLSKAHRDPSQLSSKTHSYSSLHPLPVSAYDLLATPKDNIDRIHERQASSLLQNERHSLNGTSERSRHFKTMKLHENDVSSPPASSHQPSMPRRMSGDSDSDLINSSHDVSAYGSLLEQRPNQRLADRQSLPNRTRPASLDRRRSDDSSVSRRPSSPSIRTSRPQSVSSGYRNNRGSLGAGSNKASKPLQAKNNVVFHSDLDEDRRQQPHIRQPDRSTTNKTKPKQQGTLQQPPWKS